MKKISDEQRKIVAENLLYCRKRRFPGKGGSKSCADALGVKQQQWSPWELGKIMPGDGRLEEIAKFFGTTVQWLRDKHDFHNEGDAAPGKMDLSLESGDSHAFFSLLERALSHPERGDIVVSITVKPRERAPSEKRSDV